MAKTLGLLLFILFHVALDATAQTPDRIVRYAGTWKAKIFNRNLDSVLVTWQWQQNLDSTGVFKFADEAVHSATRIGFSSEDSVVFDLLKPLQFPTGHPWDGATQRYVAEVLGDSIVGIVYTRIKDGRQGRRLFAGTRATSPAR